jgi:PAS domain S-box-containing protein
MATAGQPLAILIANNREADAARLRSWLLDDPRQSFLVAIVRTGPDALARCHHAPPDCLLLTDGLPDLDVRAILNALPRLHGLPACPIVMIAGSTGGPSHLVDGDETIDTWVAQDDLSPEALRIAIRGAVERHRLRRQLAESQARLAALTAYQPAETTDEAARVRSELLAEAGRRLAESLEPTATLTTVTDLLVPALADICIVDLFREDGTVERAAVIHADPAKAELAARLKRYPPDLTRPGVAEALRTGQADLEADVTDAMLVRIARTDNHLVLLRALGVRSHMRVPLVARGRVLGSLLLISTSAGRRYGTDDQATAEELARRSALALDNARLHAAEELARRRATSLADATRALTEVSAVPSAVLPLVAHQVATLVGDLAVVRLVSADGAWLDPVAVDHPSSTVRDEARALLAAERHPADQGATGTALRTGRPSRMAGAALSTLRRATDPSLWPPLPGTPTDALLAVPLVVEGRAIGTLSVSRASADSPYDADDERFLQELADRAALAIERARLFADIQASEERFRRIFEHAATGIAIMDLDGRFVHCNPAYAAMLGFRDQALPRLPFTTLVHPDDRAAALTEIGRVRAGELPFFESESRYLHQSGEMVWVRTFVSPLPDGSGATTHLVALATDVTERRRIEGERMALLAQEQAARADAEAAVRARDQFLSIAAHELRTPTAGIKGQAQLVLRMLRRGLVEPERLERSALGIELSANRLATLIDDLLDVARLQSGQLRLRPAPLDLAALVEAAVWRHRDHAPDNLALVFERTADAIPVVGDAGRLEQVVDNLVSNALKYSPAGGEVRVGLHLDEPEAILTVQDGGIGLPDGAADQIFRPFGRAANATTQNLPGMGLGLYISRQIVEAHGGRIEAASAGEGLGTTFTVWLPAGLPLTLDGTPDGTESPISVDSSEEIAVEQARV